MEMEKADYDAQCQAEAEAEADAEESLLTKWDLDFIGKLVDMQRDTMATRLIHIEAIVSNGSEGIKKLHKNSYRAWEEMNVLADKLDKIRGLKTK